MSANPGVAVVQPAARTVKHHHRRVARNATDPENWPVDPGN
jgi:hypothetical protein